MRRDPHGLLYYPSFQRVSATYYRTIVTVGVGIVALAISASLASIIHLFTVRPILSLRDCAREPVAVATREEAA